jgi:hypothetical protein
VVELGVCGLEVDVVEVEELFVVDVVEVVELFVVDVVEVVELFGVDVVEVVELVELDEELDDELRRGSTNWAWAEIGKVIERFSMNLPQRMATPRQTNDNNRILYGRVVFQNSLFAHFHPLTCPICTIYIGRIE